MPVPVAEIAAFFANQVVPTQQLHSGFLEQKQVEIYVRREDLLHPQVSGNKWRKLKYNLLAAAGQGFETLLTFGGAYSNHLAAVSAAGKLFGFRTIGMVRGEEHFPLNPTLQKATENGMELRYLDRETYRQKNDSAFMAKLTTQYPNTYFIPEGGTNNQALKGCVEIIPEINQPFDIVCCSAGTGGTAAGLLAGLENQKGLLVFSALKGNFLLDEINSLTQQYNGKIYQNWQLQTNYHFGGYAKVKLELMAFLQDFQKQYNIPLEPVYTGKMFFGLFDLVRKGYFMPGTKILALHTGGLQGLAGFQERSSLPFQAN